MKNPAQCHPEKFVFARGLCKSCYSKWWDKKNPERARQAKRARYKRWRDSHPEEVLRKAADYQANKAKRNAAAVAWRKANPERAREIYIKNRYGLGSEDYRKMLADQDGLCAICRKGFIRGRFKSPCVDHDHRTKKVRGLLCDPCNKMLGQAEDDVMRLQRAVQYLTRIKS